MACSNSMFLQLMAFKNVVKPGTIVYNSSKAIAIVRSNVCKYSTTATTKVDAENPNTGKVYKKMSKAMLAYLERAKAYDTFIKKEKEDYQIGKRHLANMMGEDPEFFTQADVDKAIEYLLPSGLYEKAARPIMRPPEDIFPPKKAAEFDEMGRPYHTMFYTTRPNYYKALYDIVEEINNLNELEDSMIRKGVEPDSNLEEDFSLFDWITQGNLEKLLLEKVGDKEYEYFIGTLKRLADHPYSYKAKELIMKYQKEKPLITQSLIVPELEYDSDGRPFITVPECRRKSARGTVTVKGKGTGKITVNGQSLIKHFPHAQQREQVRLFINQRKIKGVDDLILWTLY